MKFWYAGNRRTASSKTNPFFLLLATAFCGITISCSEGFVCEDRPDQDPPVECLGRLYI